jgi:hypothetical protein
MNLGFVVFLWGARGGITLVFGYLLGRVFFSAYLYMNLDFLFFFFFKFVKSL